MFKVTDGDEAYANTTHLSAVLHYHPVSNQSLATDYGREIMGHERRISYGLRHFGNDEATTPNHILL
ncbi:unnamed protein product [Taenia asiatica]|uniref:tRNA-synt_2b domain-containing protein n=1 Tax=Taenia asiatica TaxID=60517 RepID=A0A0R3WH67_TAEAS|nr:unnamed protein product [Taenia asiatica]